MSRSRKFWKEELEGSWSRTVFKLSHQPWSKQNVCLVTAKNS